MPTHPIFQMSVLACDITRMSEQFDIGVLRRNLKAIMGRKGVKPTTLSKKLGDSPTLIKDLLEKTRDTKLSTIYRIADSLDVDAADLLAENGHEVLPVGPRLYVKGEVAAGEWIEAFEWPEEDWQTLTGRPDISADQKFRFFLRVKGDSMDLIYPDGAFVECVSTMAWGAPMAGKKVVVVRRRDDERLEATVKELVDVDGDLWLAPRSSNPVHQAFRADMPEQGIREVRIVAVVVGCMRPE